MFLECENFSPVHPRPGRSWGAWCGIMMKLR